MDRLLAARATGACVLVVAVLAPATSAQRQGWQSPPLSANEAFALSSGGDVDGDGVGDIVSGPGVVRVHSGRDGSVIHSWTGTGSDAFGRSVAVLGDLDRDGHAEVLIGAYRATQGGPDAGAAYVYSGATRGLMFTSVGAAWDGEGFTVARYADLDRDGRDDYVVSAPQANGSRGAVRVRSGRDGSVLREWFGAIGSQFGVSIASLGDVDADGMPDIAIGSSALESVDVFSGASGALLRRLTIAATGSQFGHAIVGPGDLNGDGRPDVVIGAPRFVPPGTEVPGAAFAYSAATGQLLYRVDGAPDVIVNFASWIDAVDDMDGDARRDLVIGGRYQGRSGPSPQVLPTAVGVYSGAAGRLNYRIRYPEPHFGSDLIALNDAVVTGVGDLDGDGTGDVAVALGRASSGGRVLQIRHSQTHYASRLLPLPFSPVGSTGDVNADGYSDILTQDFPAGTGRVISGRDGSLVRLQTISTSFQNVVAAPLADLDGDGAEEFTLRFGGSVRLVDGWSGTVRATYSDSTACSIGDVNFDGRQDFVVASRSASPPFTYTATVYSGSMLPLFSISVTDGFCERAGDLNGDGVSEFIVGARVYSGTSGALVVQHFSPVGPFGDYDRDGVSDLQRRDGPTVFVIGGMSGQYLRWWVTTALYPIGDADGDGVGSSRVDLQACKLEYSIVSPK